MQSKKVKGKAVDDKPEVIHARKTGTGAFSLSVESYKKPVVEAEKLSKDGIALFGEDNQYPQRSIEQYKNSPTHSAICGWVGEMYAGNGFVFETKSSEVQQSTVDDWAKLVGDGRSINRIGKSIALDYKIHNGYCVQVRWAKDGKTISRIKYMDFSHVRKLIDENGDLVAYLVCKNWKAETKATDKGVIRLPAFDPEAVTRKQRDEQGNVIQDADGNELEAINPETGTPYIEEPNQLFWFAGTCPGMIHYPYPIHVAADVCIKIDVLFQDFHVNNLLNGLLPSFMLSFNGPEPEEDEKKEFIRDLDKNLRGTNGKKTIVVWGGDGVEMQAHILDVKNNEARYLEIHKAAIQQIISGHRLASPMLAGVAGTGTLGGNAQELEAAFSVAKVTIILPGQDALIEGFQDMFDKAGMPITVSIISINPFATTEQTATENSGGGDATTEVV